ncbi:hypothetical protein STUTZSP0542_35660 [Stutzerimonas marianensis]
MLELLENFADDEPRGPLIGLDDQVSYLSVKRIPDSHEAQQDLTRIGGLKQRPVTITCRARQLLLH